MVRISAIIATTILIMASLYHLSGEGRRPTPPVRDTSPRGEILHQLTQRGDRCDKLIAVASEGADTGIYCTVQEGSEVASRFYVLPGKHELPNNGLDIPYSPATAMPMPMPMPKDQLGEGIATLLNLQGLLCARVISVEDRSTTKAIACQEYRNDPSSRVVHVIQK